MYANIFRMECLWIICIYNARSGPKHADECIFWTCSQCCSWCCISGTVTLSGFTENIAVAFKPQLVESYANQELTRVKNLMYSMSKLGFLMVFLLALPISLEINYILNLWLDGTVPEDTEIFTILILLNMALGSLNIPISQTVQAVGSIMWYQIIRSGIVMSVLPITWIALRNGAASLYCFRYSGINKLH